MTDFNDPANFDLQISAPGDPAGAKTIDAFTGLENFRIERNSSRIQGPGGRAYGFNVQRSANGVDFSIFVLDTSEDLEYLRDLADRQIPVGVKATVTRNQDIYSIGQYKSLGCETGILTEQGASAGRNEEAGEIEFQVTGIGPIREYFTQ